MADEPTTPHSGSRWEPPTLAHETAPADPTPRSPRPGRRGAVAGVAVALLLAGGGAGFAIGQATAPDSTGTVVQDTDDDLPDGPPGGGRGFPPDLGGTVPDDGDPA